MCGIVGYIGDNPTSEVELISRMKNFISHRGPDFSSVHTFNNACIGFNRLSINDLSEKGNQPFSSDGVMVFCNGEIYNHKELKKKYNLEHLLNSRSDIEIIPHLYNRFGLKFLDLLNGMWAMAILDNNQGHVHLISDRWAKKPLYYTNKLDRFYFSSELKALLLGLENQVDKELLNIGFYLGYFPHPLTPIKGIKKIPPSTVLTIRNHEIFSKIWYEFKPKYSANNLSDEELQKLYYEILDDSVRIRMEADVEAGVYLSGGLDSTSIAESAQRQYKGKVHTFTGVLTGKEYSTDNQNALRFASEKDIILHEVKIDSKSYNDLLLKTCWTFDEIAFESGTLNFMMVAREAKKYVTVVLDGTGGDEIFLGYPIHTFLHSIPFFLRNLVPFGKKTLFNLFNGNQKALKRTLILSDITKFLFFVRAYTPIDLMKKSKNFNGDLLYNLLDNEIPSYINGFEDVSDLNCCSFIENLGLRMLQYQQSDLASMAFSVENRSPLSDYRLWEVMMGIEEKRKLKNGSKGLMRSISNKLPRYILEAKKDGFSSPIFEWYLKDKFLLNNILNYLRSKKEILIEFFGIEVVDTIIKKWENPGIVVWMDGINLHMLLSVLLWYQIYFIKNIKPDEQTSFTQYTNKK